jgi:hypothetical protein
MPMPLAPNSPSAAARGFVRGRPGPRLVRKATGRIAIWPIALVIYSTVVPREIAIHVGENYIYMDRLALLVTLPWVLSQMLRNGFRMVLPDWLVLFTGIWMVTAIAQVHGIERATVTGLSLSFDTLAGYFVARVAFRSLDDIRRTLILCAPAFFFAALTLPIESLSHQLLVRPFFQQIFGQIRLSGGSEKLFDIVRADDRFGLLRAYGPWEHPILAGLHLATLPGIYWQSGIRGLPFLMALTAAGLAIFTFSSAAVLGLGLVLGALVYDAITRQVKGLSWPVLIYTLVGGLLLTSVVTNSGVVNLLIRFATLDPTTGYFRLAIWQYASESVWAHPVFGIGFEDYSRPSWMVTSSIDAHWLLLAVRYGLPGAIAMFSASVIAIAGLVSAERLANRRDAAFYRGILISFITLVLLAFTVTLQGGILTWFTVLLGGCVACAQHAYVVDWAFWNRSNRRGTAPRA